MTSDRRVLEQTCDALAATRADLGRLAARAAAFLAAATDRQPSDIEIYGAGALVHGYYNVLERLFERVARDLDAGPPEGPDWHRVLLRSMALDKPLRRPAVLDDETVRELGRYLGFRHLFRHLYVLDLRWGEIRLLLEDLAPLHARLDAHLAVLGAALETAAAE